MITGSTGIYGDGVLFHTTTLDGSAARGWIIYWRNSLGHGHQYYQINAKCFLTQGNSRCLGPNTDEVEYYLDSINETPKTKPDMVIELFFFFFE